MGSYCQLHEHTLHQWHEEKRQRRHQQSQEPAEARWAPFEQSMIYTTCCSQHTFAWTKREPTFPLYKGKLRKIEIAKSIKKNLSAFIIRQKYQYSIFKHFSTTTYHLPFCFWLFFNHRFVISTDPLQKDEINRKAFEKFKKEHSQVPPTIDNAQPSERFDGESICAAVECLSVWVSGCRLLI